MTYTLETVCKELRLNSLPSLVDDPTQEEWLLKLLINEVEDKEERFIRIYIAEKMDQFYIYVSNSFEGKIKKKGSKYFTTKDERQRGYGIIRIDGIVEKNRGMINRQSEKNIFATEIILPLSY